MGYYTQFDASNNAPEVLAAIKEISGYNWAGAYLNAKWYDCAKHCNAVSLQFPDTLITLEGSGEEDGDIWKQYWLNGKTQECKAIISFEEFDVLKLN